MQRGIKVQDARPNQGIPADVAEGAKSGQRKGGGVEEVLRVLSIARQNRINASYGVRAIEAGADVRGVARVCADGQRKPGLIDQNSTELPSPGYRIEHAIREVQRAPPSDRKIVQYRADESMRGVEDRQCALTTERMTVLWEWRVGSERS